LRAAKKNSTLKNEEYNNKIVDLRAQSLKTRACHTNTIKKEEICKGNQVKNFN